MYADDALRPWFDAVAGAVPGIDLIDVHTHLGFNDPDGYKCSPAELLEALDQAGARAVTYPMAEPGGYPEANDRVMGQVAEAPGRLSWFCRVNPNLGSEATTEARRCLDAGASGIKLHPRAEQFTMDHREVRALVALAHERHAPLIVHAGRGIPALGRHAVALAAEFPDARLILAHVGLSDLGWIWRAAREHRNLYFDTAWWSAPDLLALFGLVPPGQILFGSDVPYGTTLSSVGAQLRCGLQLGLSGEQMRGIAGGQTARLLEAAEPLDLGDPPGLEDYGPDPLLDRVHTYLVGALVALFTTGEAAEQLALARLACDVDPDAPHGEAYRSILALLEAQAQYAPHPEKVERPQRGGHFVVTALMICRTPDVPLPPGPGAEAPPPPR
jgi:predicted TIM-barrel fold metal-dependent hydrolase